MERKVASSSPAAEDFSGHKLAIMFVLCTHAYSVYVVYIFICNVSAFISWHLLIINSRNIALGLAALIKKHLFELKVSDPFKNGIGNIIFSPGHAFLNPASAPGN